jgi:hypothetical protein
MRLLSPCKGPGVLSGVFSGSKDCPRTRPRPRNRGIFEHELVTLRRMGWRPVCGQAANAQFFEDDDEDEGEYDLKRPRGLDRGLTYTSPSSEPENESSDPKPESSVLARSKS